jgi:hypothetical protein
MNYFTKHWSLAVIVAVVVVVVVAAAAAVAVVNSEISKFKSMKCSSNDT